MAMTLRCMTFNIWSEYRAGRWEIRRDAAAHVVRYHRPEVLGLQEAQRHMIDDLVTRLRDYAWVGTGRNEGTDAGEFTPLLYRSDRFDCVEHATFWLGPDVRKSGRSWDAACPRIVTWARLRDLDEGHDWVCFNTHFDHFGKNARRESARLLVRTVFEVARTDPALVMGDFNCRDSSVTYRILTTGDGDPALALKDAKSVSVHGHHGPRKTWRGIAAGMIGSARIDFIFVKNGVCVLDHATLGNEWNGVIASDHNPVLAEVSVL
jgi:endonuclease/exonuclease/phosphatase family metal-dependent hydrolase